MNPESCEVRSFPSRQQADQAGFTVALTDDEASYLASLSLEARKEWLDANLATLAERKRPRLTQEMIDDRETSDINTHPYVDHDPHPKLCRGFTPKSGSPLKRTRTPGPGAKVSGRFKVRK